MILDVKNIDITTHAGIPSKICKQINFSLNLGETLGILGESGSGKSITALSLVNLLPPGISITSGKTNFYKGDSFIDLTKLSANEMQQIRGREISMIFQEPMTSLNPVMSCGNQIAETLKFHLRHNNKEAKEYSLELFRKVQMTDPERIFRSYPYQLSGGQKQRVMIAMAIACKPKILIADEPTTALDVTVQKSILLLLKELQAEMGMGIIFISHDISVLSEISHRVAVFYKGEVVEEGSTKEILHTAHHPYSRGLMACRFSTNKKGERLKTLSDFLESSHENPEIIISPKRSNSESETGYVFEVNNLKVAFQKSGLTLFAPKKYNTIINSINFQVNKGETLGLVGESGSGKTTIGRTLLRLIDFQSGNILFHGQKISEFSGNQLKQFRRKVQIIFQDPYSSLNPKFTIGECIEEPLNVHKIYKRSAERKKRVLELLRMVQLSEEHYNRYPHQFSGGQRQRIGIARALALEPELLILDEAVAALDVSIQAQILNLLNDLKRVYNLTYIFVSHDLNIVRYMSDRIIVLKDGEIVEEGDADALFNSPKQSYTQNLLSSIPGL